MSQMIDNNVANAADSAVAFRIEEDLLGERQVPLMLTGVSTPCVLSKTSKFLTPRFLTFLTLSAVWFSPRKPLPWQTKSWV